MATNQDPKYTGGRHRKHNRDQIANDLIEWAQLDTSTNLCGFCGIKLIAPQKLTTWAKECDNFREALDIAKTLLGDRREKLLAQDMLHVKSYDLNAKVYDHFLKEESKEEKEFESKLKADENAAATAEDLKRHQETLDQLKALRSERNIDNNSNKPDK